MVSQIANIGNDIKSRIHKLESFAMFAIDENGVNGEGNQQQQQRGKDGKLLGASGVVLKTPTQQKDLSTSVTPAFGDNEAERKLTTAPKKGKKVTIRELDEDDGIKSCQVYFRAIEDARNTKTENMLKLYDSIGPILTKLESLVLGTFTGKCPKMKYYYNFWEKEAFSCFTRFATKNMEQFMKALNQDRTIFQVDAVLSIPDILMRPTAAEVYSIMIHSMQDFLDRLVL
jgi:dynein heavy chain